MALNNPALKSGSKYADLKRRLWFLLGALVVYRIGTHIPVPGINASVLDELFRSQQGGILGLFNVFSGGALSRFSILALGIMPYISASIIMQLCTVVVPSLEALKKEGEAGRRKITQYTRYGTLGLAFFQAFGISMALEQQAGLVLNPGLSFQIVSAVTLVTGTMFLMWLGEQITERGLGNGISLLIFAGIAAGLPAAIGQTLEQARTGAYSIPLVLGIVILVVVVTGFVVFVERALRKILVNYAKRQVGNKVYQGQSSHLPLKLNMAGVIPPIFASSIILFPATLAQWFGSGEGTIWLRDLAATLAPGQPVHEILYAAAIIFFCFFYTALQYNPKETAENLKKSGAFIPGYRPGDQTARYIERITLRLTLLGSIYLVIVCFVPNFLIAWKNVPFYFGGTSLLIIVVVTMDFMTQVQAYLMSQQYESLLKKANFKGGLPTR
ncbi:MAG: preprotein translocase subunit SecY [Betaproteobacteria bacterium]|nr:preprotein translocase subunit SecY [Betaproteobacteria bacterium]MBK6601873.1 preprotein translocase subunit SecY [Betaproteobacteria bacterium]MBK7082637.1 preprotein translocase subunit SecY [Betaproteobacteria bacterium]MBK7591467.1 preprotein translocase subunit SecY [Betaproteobacteria bacterium]MBK8690107.1 preprotein translocase subunit SecY [Betaproteobacteria bacterium]